MGASNGAGGGSAELSQMWRSVYKKAADAAEARTASLLDEHVYQAHGRRALTIVVEGEAAGAATGNTTMYTQTTAPAGAANSLWFNPSEVA